MEIGDPFWSFLGAISALVAALAALGTIAFAHLTVRLAKRAQIDATKAHAEQMAHRHRALVAELTLRRVEQVERVSSILAQVAAAAQKEATEVPGRVAGSEDRRRLSRLPALFARLGVALATLDSIGGPDLRGVRSLVKSGYSGGPAILVNAAVNCLDEARLVLGDLDTDSIRSDISDTAV